MRWAVVVPVKRLSEAKSRLDARPADERARLALAFATDTVDAVRRTACVELVVVVTDDRAARRALETVAVVMDDRPGVGLNGAVDAGVAGVVHTRSDLAVAALVSDLPALRESDLTAALAVATEHPRAYVADAGGSGTTLLTATPGRVLQAAFGSGSALRHEASGARAVDGALSSLRRDVDTEADLLAAQLLGVGPATRTALSRS